MLALGRAQGGGDSDVHGVFFRDFGVTLTERCPRILVAFWEVYKEGFQGVAVARGRSTRGPGDGTVDHGH